MNQTEIEDMIPHRPPFLWIDHVTELEPGKRCVALKVLDASEPVFRGHFPGAPVFPGVLLIEVVAQTAAVMLSGTASGLGTPRIGAVNWFRFLRVVSPGMELRVETRLVTQVGAVACIEGMVWANDELMAKGELSVSRA